MEIWTVVPLIVIPVLALLGLLKTVAFIDATQS